MFTGRSPIYQFKHSLVTRYTVTKTIEQKISIAQLHKGAGRNVLNKFDQNISENKREKRMYSTAASKGYSDTQAKKIKKTK
jgi:hypothetical protein